MVIARKVPIIGTRWPLASRPREATDGAERGWRVACAARSQSRTDARVLCVFPHYTPSFGTFNHAYRLMKGVRAFMPPQGLLLIAAYMPEGWPVRFIDENIAHGDAPPTSRGPTSCWSAACTSRRRRSTTSTRARTGGRQGDGAGRAVGVGLAGDVSGHRLSPHRRDRRCHRPARSPRSTTSVARPPRRCASRPRSGCRSHDFPIPAYDLIPLDDAT